MAFQLDDRFWSKVHKTETCWVWTAGKTPAGYGTIKMGGRKGRTEYAHRLSFADSNGAIADGMVIDHVCRNRACVNPDHLRQVTRKQNNEHRGGVHRGTTFFKQTGKWRAQITHNYKTISVGYFDTQEEAAEAARKARLELFTHNDMDRSA